MLKSLVVMLFLFVSVALVFACPEGKQCERGIEVPLKVDLVSGTKMEATIFTGVNAPTKVNSDIDHVPLLIKFTDITVFQKVNEKAVHCLALARGYGKAENSRVYLNLDTLECVDIEGRILIQQKVSGQVEDLEGNPGVIGSLITKTGGSMKAILTNDQKEETFIVIKPMQKVNVVITNTNKENKKEN